jgi:hypothetical protein
MELPLAFPKTAAHARSSTGPRYNKVKMHFEVLGEITEAEVIARGSGIRRLKMLRKRYGGRNWRKLKGVAEVRLGSAVPSGVRKFTGTKRTA